MLVSVRCIEKGVDYLQMKRLRIVAGLLAVFIVFTVMPLSGIAVSDGAQKLINAAEKYIGKTGKSLGFTVDWCSLFVQKCANDAGLVKNGLFPKATATSYDVKKKKYYGIGYASAMADWFTQNDKGKYYYFTLLDKSMDKNTIKKSRSSFVPQPGDLILFDFDGRNDIDHIGIVTKNDGSKVRYIDGNSGPGTRSTRKVKRDWYTKTNSVIAGYIRPNYAQQPVEVKIAFSDLSGPGTLIVGKGNHIKGTISSTGAKLSSIAATVKDSNNKTVMTKIVNPNTYSYSLENSDLDYKLTFGDLKSGSYSITYTAKASNKTATSKAVSFQVQAKQSKYVLMSGASSWVEAEVMCRQKGGHMATISSQAENDYIYNILKKANCKDAYFGLVRHEGKFQWVTGEPVVYTNWNPGEPNNQDNNEDCAMFYNKSQPGRWNDGHMTPQSIFICELDGWME